VAHSEPLPIRLALSRECELVRHGLAGLLAPYAHRVVLTRSSSEDPPSTADVTLHDSLARPPASLAALDDLLGTSSSTHVVTFTWNCHPGLARQVVDRGASGCLAKDLPADRLVAAIEAVHAGRTVIDTGRLTPLPHPDDVLTPREAEVITLITRGLENSEVARETFLSINSVKSHIRSAYRKMGVTSRSQAVLWGVRHGYGAPDLWQDHEPAPALIG
jgi:DNA-binding NarL/FixJ family response regulator